MPLHGFLNQTLVDQSTITVSIQDLTIFRGMGVFDYMRTYHRKPFLLEDHIRRFLNSCRLLGLQHDESDNSLTDKINQLATLSPLDDSAFRLIMTAGMGNHSLESGKGNLIILTEPISPYPKEYYENGIKAKMLDFTRYLPQAKSLTYTQAVIELGKIKKDGFNEIIYHTGNMITEGTTCNLFLVQNNKLVTNEEQVLLGTRRKFILSWANSILPIEIKNLTQDDLKTASEAFITSTTREILPIVQLDNQLIGNGKVGEWTKKLHHVYLQKIEKLCQ